MTPLSAPLKPLRLPELWLALWLTFVGFTIVTSLMSIPVPEVDISYADKWMHLVTYGLLAATAVQVFRPGRVLLAVALGLVLLGIGLELCQGAFTENRIADWRDAVANTIGVGLGAATVLTPIRDALLHLMGRTPA